MLRRDVVSSSFSSGYWYDKNSIETTYPVPPSFEAGDLIAKLRNHGVTLLHLEIKTCLRVRQGLCADLRETIGDASLEFEAKLRLLVFQGLLHSGEHGSKRAGASANLQNHGGHRSRVEALFI